MSGKEIIRRLALKTLSVFFIVSFLIFPLQSDVAARTESGSTAKELIYRLAPFDKISLSVYGEPDLETEQLITDDGVAFIPLVGPLKLGGLTVSEASRLVERAFVEKEYLRRPVVTISIEEFAPKVVTVLGEVERPGNVNIPPGRNSLPIQIVIAEAGGFTGTAKSTDVKVARASTSSSGKVNDLVNVDAILNSRKRGSGKDYLVYTDDVVFVPRRVF